MVQTLEVSFDKSREDRWQLGVYARHKSGRQLPVRGVGQSLLGAIADLGKQLEGADTKFDAVLDAERMLAKAKAALDESSRRYNV